MHLTLLLLYKVGYTEAREISRVIRNSNYGLCIAGLVCLLLYHQDHPSILVYIFTITVTCKLYDTLEVENFIYSSATTLFSSSSWMLTNDAP